MAVNHIDLAVGQAWKTRDGRLATIVSIGVSNHVAYPVIAHFETEGHKSYDLNGRFSTMEETSNDLVCYVCNEESASGGYVKQADPSKDALDVQVGGDHYKSCAIQPVEYIHANGLDFFQGNVVKYITRHKTKNGAADLRKAIHYCQLALQLQYGEKL